MKTRKLLSIILSAVTLLSTILAAPSVGAYKFKVGDFLYKWRDDGTLILEKYTGNNNSLIIPSDFCGYKVTSISKNAFLNCKTWFKKITIPDSISDISKDAFLGINTNILSIGKNVQSLFYGYGDIKVYKKIVSRSNFFKVVDDVVYNKNKTKLLYCPKYKKISDFKLPDSVQYIETCAFQDCNNISKIDLNNVRTIQQSAFESCKKLKSIDITSKVKYIGKYAFRYSGLKELKIKENKNLKIKHAAFANTKIKSLIVPKNIEKSGFECCHCLEKIKIPANVKVISSRLFFDCVSLKTVTIPPTVKKIGNYAFGFYYDDPDEAPIEKVIIKGVKNSTAEKYAKKNKIKFKVINQFLSK